MKDKIKNGYFFMYGEDVYLKVGSRCYYLPLFEELDKPFLILYKHLDESKIKAVYKANWERVE